MRRVVLSAVVVLAVVRPGVEAEHEPTERVHLPRSHFEADRPNRRGFSRDRQEESESGEEDPADHFGMYLIEMVYDEVVVRVGASTAFTWKYRFVLDSTTGETRFPITAVEVEPPSL